MVGRAQRTRAPIQRLADVIAAYFVQAVIAIAIVTALGVVVSRARAEVQLCVHQRHFGAHHRLSLRAWPRHAHFHDRCMGQGARLGILFRNAEAIQRMREHRYVSGGQDRHARRWAGRR